MADVMLTTYAAAQAIDSRASGADVGFVRVTTDSRAVQAGIYLSLSRASALTRMILSPARWLLARRQRWCARIFLSCPAPA